MASWPKHTCSACHTHRMETAEDRHYCTVSAGELVRAGTAVAVYNVDTGQLQVVESSWPRDTDRSHTTRVSSPTRGNGTFALSVRINPRAVS